MSVIIDNAPQLLDGLRVTLELTLGGMLLALFMSFSAGFARLSRFRPVRVVAVVYIEFFRGTSALVQLFWLFFALPLIGITLSAMTVGITGLGLCVGAYGAEVVRAAILAVPKSQYEAAIALNLTQTQTTRHVILPQALLTMMPSFGNLFIELLKITALVSLITLQDLTFQAQSINATTLRTVEIFTFVLVVYFAVSLVITFGMRSLERWLGAGLDRGGLR